VASVLLYSKLADGDFEIDVLSRLVVLLLAADSQLACCAITPPPFRSIQVSLGKAWPFLMKLHEPSRSDG
jgi:hypothetical protein